MKLLKIVEMPLKHWNIAPVDRNEMKLKDPTPWDFEKAVATCNVNGYDTLIIYSDKAA